MGIDHRIVQFRTGEPQEVIDEIVRIKERGDADEWITLTPWIDPEDAPPVRLASRLFSGRGPKIPEVTWVPSSGDTPAQLGVLHAKGPNSMKRIADAGVELPPGWRPTQDHSKWGMLFEVSADATPETIISFAVNVTNELAVLPTDDRWVCRISGG